ncbi:unnamed protein product [Echinostoma caproni]|uniref:Expressed conserved protein n=1 Tax=Echinostoma caproni TaxID=27848 RepID=A0A183A1Q1_9TREM|nr:unnamed protein product [Echinostoma caproni]
MGPSKNRKQSTFYSFPCVSACDVRARSTANIHSFEDKVQLKMTSDKNLLNPSGSTNHLSTAHISSYGNRRAKSQMLLNSKGDPIRHMPSHIMPELLYDLSRTGSHISLDLTSSSDEEFGSQRSVVKPNAPKVIILNAEKKKTHSKDKPTTEPVSRKTVSKPDQEIHSTYRVLIPKQPQMVKRSSMHTPQDKDFSSTNSLPSRCQSRPQSSSILLNKIVPPGSAENFMQDATYDLSRDEYDPYGLVRRNFRNWFGESIYTNPIGGANESRTSSGQFSLSSCQSAPSPWTIPRAFDRRRRRNGVRSNLITEVAVL